MKKRAFTAMIALILLLSACSSEEKSFEQAFFAMDTYIEITAYGENSESAVRSAEEEIKLLDLLLSVTDENSEIYRINSGESFELSPLTDEILERSLEMCAETNGVLDITVYPLLKLWGFTTDKNRVPSDAEIAESLKLVNYKQVKLIDSKLYIPDGFQIDLGATAKGFAADKAAEILKSSGVSRALLNLGGAILTIGEKSDGKPWTIAVQDPFSEENLCTVKISDKAAVTSGAYQRYFEENGVKYHHIMDVSEGRPSDSGAASVTVVGESAFVCDALSTAFFVMGIDDTRDYLASHSEISVIFVSDLGKIYVSEALKDGFVNLSGLNVEFIS